MEPIIGRKPELERLYTYYKSGKAEFVALYGRRRVGKTFLIHQFFGNRFDFDTTGVMNGSKAEELTAFHSALKAYGFKGRKARTWMDAFFNLRQLLESKIQAGKRCVVFIDELPCFDTAKSGFVNAFGHFWNSWANWQPEIMLIVCGSATSWMVRNIIDNHGGLHDRITHEMHLHPFTLKEAEDYFKANNYGWNRLSVLQAYMAIGGIPYYMSLFRPGESPAMGFDRLFFVEGAELRKEYSRLFSSLFKNAKPYMDIIEAMAKHGSGMTREEIAEVLNTYNNGNLGEMLTDLEYCDFIRKTRVRNKEIKTNSQIYELIDFYTIFYQTFIHKKDVDENFWTRNVGASPVRTWYGLAYERVCKAHIPQIKEALGIAAVSTETYAWKIPGAQVDLIIDRKDDLINICEIKYSTSRYELEKEEYLKIMHRIEAFGSYTGTASSLIPTMITTQGLTEGMYSHQIISVLQLDDLFR